MHLVFLLLLGLFEPKSPGCPLVFRLGWPPGEASSGVWPPEEASSGAGADIWLV